MRRFLHVRVISCVILCLGIGIFFIQGKSHTALAACGSWTAQTPPTVNGNNTLFAVTAVDSTTAWAAGTSGSNNNMTLIEQWNGTSWQVVASPNSPMSGLNVLTGIAAAAPNDIWAVGYYNRGQDQTLTEHWDGTSWSIVASPNVPGTSNRLNAVTAISSSNIWAVGYSGIASAKTLIEHYDGTSWTIVHSPNLGTGFNYLNGVAGDAVNDIYAVGDFEDLGSGSYYHALFLHYDGKQWGTKASPRKGNNSNWLQSITLIGGTTQFWAAGYYQNGGYANALIEMWNGSSWNVFSSPNAGAYNSLLYGITAPDTNNAWAVGNYRTASGSIQTLIEYYNGTSWSIVPSPNTGPYENDLYATAAYNDNTAWTVGQSSTTQIGNPQALIEFYC